MQEKALPNPTIKQDFILKLLYKFRFITTHTLASYNQQSDHTQAYKTLEKLKDYGYVIKRYDKLAKIDRKNAIYSLSVAGIRYLRDRHGLNEQALHAMYKNSLVTEAFAQEHIEIMKVCNVLRKSYPDKFDIFTKTELIDQDYFPDPRPDLYLRRREETSRPSEFMLFMVTDVQLFVIKKRLKSWLTHYEEEGWDGDYPAILLVCGTQSIENRVRAYLESLELDDELKVHTATKKAIFDSPEANVWSDYLNVKAPDGL